MPGFYEFLFASPFGFLNPIHHYILANAEPLTLATFPSYILIPLIPLFLQAYLLFDDGTQHQRMALGAVTVAMMLRGWTGYRFIDPTYNMLNNLFSVVYFLFFLKPFEFAFLPRVVDPFMIERGRPQWVAAIDIIINHRNVSLGRIGLDAAGPTNQELKKVTVPRFLPKLDKDLPRTRLGSVLRHLSWVWLYYINVCIGWGLLVRTDPQEILTRQGGYGPGALNAFVENTAFMMPFGYRAPGWLVRSLFRIAAPASLMSMMTWGYHTLAAITIASGFWEPDSWDVNLFNKPWLGDSMSDLWARRWHQVLRHSLGNLSTLSCLIFHLPMNSLTFVPLSFFWSGVFHIIFQLPQDKPPDAIIIWALFFNSGMGCLLETLFRRVTGKRVGGIWGRIWMWAYLVLIGQNFSEEWFDAGYAGAGRILDNTIGAKYIAPFLLKYFMWIVPNSPADAVVAAAKSSAEAMVAA